MTGLFNTEGYEKHVKKTVGEMVYRIRLGQPCRSSDWEDDAPDIFVQKPELVVDVKTIRDASLTGSVSERQIKKHHGLYGDKLRYAIWSKKGRVELSAEELLERSGKARQGTNGRGSYYVFDVSADTFVDPFEKTKIARGPKVDPDTLDLQIDLLAGRAVRNPTRRTPSRSQVEVLHGLRMAGSLETWEAGALIHAMQGFCPDYPSRRGLTRSLRENECCHACVDDGSRVLCGLRDQGRIWQDEESGLWRLFPEDWVFSDELLELKGAI